VHVSLVTIIISDVKLSLNQISIHGVEKAQAKTAAVWCTSWWKYALKIAIIQKCIW